MDNKSNNKNMQENDSNKINEKRKIHSSTYTNNLTESINNVNKIILFIYI
jgi:hypothetical protein